jgi:phosphocarrier protein HPr
MKSTNYIITATDGMHARPATALVRLAKNFKSAVSLKKGDKVVRLNSLLNILSLMIKGGDTISIIVEGEDETDAAAAIDLFFNEQLKGL